MIDLCATPPPAIYYYQMVQPYRDKFNLITQKDFDGGDSAHRTGLFYLGLYLNYKDDSKVIVQIKKDFEKDLSKLEYKKGHFVRNPDPDQWYSNPKNFSRDQTTPLIVALGVLDKKDIVFENMIQLIETFGFYPNSLKNWTNKQKVFPLDFRDFAGLSDWGAYIRALDWKWAYPYLLISDTQLLGSTIIRLWFSHVDQDDSSDDLNLTVHLIQSDLNMPTPLSKLAKWVYKQKVINRSHDKTNPIHSYWQYYFSHEAHNRPPIDEVFRCPIQKYFYDDN